MSRLAFMWEWAESPYARGFLRGFVYGNAIGMALIIGILGATLVVGRFLHAS